MTVAAAALAFVALSATAALAHAQFQTTTNGLPANSQQSLRMYVPNERDDSNYNISVAVYFPDSWAPVSCATKATWDCALGASDGRQTITFTKAAGAAPAEDEYFAFVARTASSAGAYAFPTLQTYNDNEVVRWIGPKGSDQPAPILNVLASGDTPSSVTPTTAHSGHATPTVTPAGAVATSTTSGGGALQIPDNGQGTTTTDVSIATLPSGGEGGDGPSTAVIVGLLAAAAVVGAAIVAIRSRRPRS
ncbi:MAG TPA: DUF1775 domain-containing protein [Acidimicrobiales bacterium]|nr:DUF1775 domain-containing protein [Acidimicrobiales bacterium]